MRENLNAYIIEVIFIFNVIKMYVCPFTLFPNNNFYALILGYLLRVLLSALAQVSLCLA